MLNGLVGGKETVTLGDGMAKQLQAENKTSFSKVTQQRAGAPVFEVVIELTPDKLHEWVIVTDSGKAVDDILAGKRYKAQIRRRDPENTGRMTIELVNL